MTLELFDIRNWSLTTIISAFGFFSGLSSFPFFFILLSSNVYVLSSLYPPFIIIPLMVGLFYAFDNILSKLFKVCKTQSGNFWRACGLGFAFAFGVYFVYFSQVFALESKLFWSFGLYICIISFFHWSEYFVASLCNPQSVSIDLYMLNHSPEYLAAAACSFFEHWVGSLFRYCFFYNWRAPAWLSILGLLICIGGEVLRKLAMITASTNFNHFVQFRKQQDHGLVTHGVYGYFRHPAYVGWFYWSLGTQILLANPICMIAYPIAAYRFFEERILIEEKTLVSFFGARYRMYQLMVPCGIPFIRGFVDMAS